MNKDRKLNFDENYCTIGFLVNDIIEQIKEHLNVIDNNTTENKILKTKTENLVNYLLNYIEDINYFITEPIDGNLITNEYNQFIFNSEDKKIQKLLEIGDKLELFIADNYYYGEVDFSNVYYFKNYFIKSSILKSGMKCRMRINKKMI